MIADDARRAHLDRWAPWSQMAVIAKRCRALCARPGRRAGGPTCSWRSPEPRSRRYGRCSRCSRRRPIGPDGTRRRSCSPGRLAVWTWYHFASCAGFRNAQSRPDFEAKFGPAGGSARRRRAAISQGRGTAARAVRQARGRALPPLRKPAARSHTPGCLGNGQLVTLAGGSAAWWRGCPEPPGTWNGDRLVRSPTITSPGTRGVPARTRRARHAAAAGCATRTGSPGQSRSCP